ncbi:MAG: ComEC/Rec2 family competence protein [Patescibacteria group bacterium]|nr:ComEC/Rec2 family competence protein [Patescibacteria group bacterium]
MSKSNYRDGQEISFEAALFSEPQAIGNFQRFPLSLPTGETVFVTAPAFPEYKYGDRVMVSSPIRILPRAGGFQPRALEEQSYGVSTQAVEPLISKRIYTMYFPKISLVKPQFNPLLAVTAFIRQSVTTRFNNNLPPDLSSLLLGIVFGIKAPMSANFLGNLRIAGVMHVIAASGMNITMVAGFLSSIFTLFLRRQTALLASIIGIVFYAFLAGMQPSIIRAAIMGILVFSSQILGRQSLGAYGLFLAAFMMLFISPGLISDVGFQLSFAATAGLLYLNPLFGRAGKLNSLIKRFPLLEDLFITFSAQLSTLPILLATFGTYSLWSIPANALVLWTVPVLMILGGVGAILGMIFLPLGSILVYFCLPLLLYFQKIVIFFSSLGGVLTIRNLPLTFILGYYLLVLSFVFYFSKPKKS